jgi:hypothetical protein
MRLTSCPSRVTRLDIAVARSAMKQRENHKYFHHENEIGVMILPKIYKSRVCACAKSTGTAASVERRRREFDLAMAALAAAPVLFAHAVVTETKINRILTPKMKKRRGRAKCVRVYVRLAMSSDGDMHDIVNGKGMEM